MDQSHRAFAPDAEKQVMQQTLGAASANSCGPTSVRCYSQMMDSRDLSQALHVIGSDSAAGSLKVALHLSRDQVLINEDPISCGPAPATDDLDLWRSTRERFLRNLYVDWLDFSFDAYADNGLLMNAERLGQSAPVVVWAARGLPEQLLLAWVVFLFDRLGFDVSRLRAIQFENLRPGQRVLTMGELSPENIQKHCPEPRHLNSDQVKELRRAWKVYTSSDPAALPRYVAETNRLPLLHQAVRQLVYRYPDLQSGASVWDERLLHYTLQKGPMAARVIGYTMGYNETPDVVGDCYLFRRLIALASADLRSPLVSIIGSTRTMRECQVKLTAFGQKVLAGEANHVQENGIDDWVGGVHLSTEGPIAFRKGDSLILPL